MAQRIGLGDTAAGGVVAVERVHAARVTGDDQLPRGIIEVCRRDAVRVDHSEQASRGVILVLHDLPDAIGRGNPPAFNIVSCAFAAAIGEDRPGRAAQFVIIHHGLAAELIGHDNRLADGVVDRLYGGTIREQRISQPTLRIVEELYRQRLHA